MALEQFRTQVLLLHSQQSTLDALGAGFNDRYSVHFATSGSEALTTLGETPIHVIVSAQDLPGMSGLEALREAKKRSPDTVGILLAGDNRDDGLEALVGDKEVFQVVRGVVEPQALLKIVENATRRVRMLTLSESANDTAANVDVSSPQDEDEGEHIVMETAENGTTIISDGTGRMPALKPEKIQVTPEAGGRNVDVLVLTKDSEFLDTIRESSRGLHTVHHATTGQQAQDAVKSHPVGVLVTDAAIAGDKVELLVRKLRSAQPRMVAIVAGRRDDGEMLMELINRGQVYRFLLKPVSPGRARLAVEASVKHHLEGPDTAFKGAPPVASVATVSKPQPAPKPAPAAAPARPAPAPAPEAKAQPAEKVEPTLAPEPAATPDAAAEDFAVDSLSETGSFKETVAEMTATIGRAKSSGTSGGSSKTRVPLIAAGAAAVVLAAGGIWYFTAGSGDDTGAASTAETTAAPAATPAVTESDIPAQPAATADAPAETAAEPAPAPTPEYVALLDNARFARDSGRLLAPAGDNAVEWYVAAREAAPGNAVVAGELDNLLQQVIGMAETALLENRMADAEAALAMVALASPGNSRLAFLNAQLAQMQLRATLDEARLAIRESRFEDAGRLLTAAQAIPGADTAQIDQVTEDLAAARSAQRVDDVLAQANARLGEDSLVAPANDNARYFFELALSNDAGNQAAQQGLLVVASKLVLKARAAIDAGDLDAAGSYLQDARELDATSPELQASETALENALAVAAEAAAQAEAERLAAEQEAAAQRAAEERRRAAASATLSTAAPAAGSDSDGQSLPAPVYAPASAKPGTEQVASAPVDRAPKAVAISQLTRTNYVAPEYPRGAQRRNLSGWVDIGFTVTENGETTALEVIESTPGTVFDDAASEAVARWRFEPFTDNGSVVPVRVAVRMSFSLE